MKRSTEFLFVSSLFLRSLPTIAKDLDSLHLNWADATRPDSVRYLVYTDLTWDVYCFRDLDCAYFMAICTVQEDRRADEQGARFSKGQRKKELKPCKSMAR